VAPKHPTADDLTFVPKTATHHQLASCGHPIKNIRSFHSSCCPDTRHQRVCVAFQPQKNSVPADSSDPSPRDECIARWHQSEEPDPSSGWPGPTNGQVQFQENQKGPVSCETGPERCSAWSAIRTRRQDIHDPVEVLDACELNAHAALPRTQGDLHIRIQTVGER